MPEYDSTISYRDVPGFPGYKVGSDGSVWTCWERVWRKGMKGAGSFCVIGSVWQQLKPKTDQDGYRECTLRKNCKSYFRRVHHLVLLAFVGPKPKGMVCRHFPDRNPANNNLDNLQWGTPKENTADCLLHGTYPIGVGNGHHKLTEAEVREIRSTYALGDATQTQLAIEYNVSQHAISAIVTRKLWRHI